MPLTPAQQGIADDLLKHMFEQTVERMSSTLRMSGDLAIANDVGYRFPLTIFVYAMSMAFAESNKPEAEIYAWMGELAKNLVEETDDLRAAMLHDPSMKAAVERAKARMATYFPGQ